MLARPGLDTGTGLGEQWQGRQSPTRTGPLEAISDGGGGHPLPDSLLLPCTNSGVPTWSLQEKRQNALLPGKVNALETRRQRKGPQRHKLVSTTIGGIH